MAVERTGRPTVREGVGSRLRRYVLMEAREPVGGEDLQDWLSRTAAQAGRHDERARYWFRWTVGVAVVGVTLAFSGVATALGDQLLPSWIDAGLVSMVLWGIPATPATWHASKATHLRNAYASARGRTTKFWTPYRWGALLVVLIAVFRLLRSG